MRVVAIGFNTAVMPNWKELVEPPEAPSNYKDEAKIKEYIEKAWIRAAEEARNKPVTGQLSEVVAFTHGNGAPQPVDLGWPDLPPLVSLGQFDRIVAVNLRLFLKLAVLDYLRRGTSRVNLQPQDSWAMMGDYQHAPVFVSNLTKQLIDPVQLLFSSAPSNPFVRGLGIAPADNYSLAAIASMFPAGFQLPAVPSSKDLALFALSLSDMLPE